MLKLGLIGTSWISSSFAEAASLSGRYRPTAVYSRQAATDLQLKTTYPQIQVVTDFDEFVALDLDVIYIASPNAIHFEQAKAALKAGKHVIVEKPAFSNPQELDDILALADQQQRFCIEAARNFHEPTFKVIQDFLADKSIVGADFTYAKYSSKMPLLLAGDTPNKFRSDMSGGLLADLGVYLLYAAYAFFGEPIDSHYDAQVLDSGVDIAGVGVLDYPGFKVAIKTGGNLTSYLPCEIYTSTGTLVLDAVNAISEAYFLNFEGQKTPLDLPKIQHNMLDEALTFANIIEAKQPYHDNTDYPQLVAAARSVAKTSAHMRKQAGIIFAADKP